MVTLNTSCNGRRIEKAHVAPELVDHDDAVRSSRIVDIKIVRTREDVRTAAHPLVPNQFSVFMRISHLSSCFSIRRQKTAEHDHRRPNENERAAMFFVPGRLRRRR